MAGEVLGGLAGIAIAVGLMLGLEIHGIANFFMGFGWSALGMMIGKRWGESL